MAMKKILLLVLVIGLTLILSACQANANGSAQAVETYLQALVDENQERLLTTSCADWEESAILELDSFKGVSASLKDVSCKQTGTEGDSAIVQCSGSIEATYNNEQRQLPLEGRGYKVVQDQGNWLVCGIQE
jgi:hypothetical protein